MRCVQVNIDFHSRVMQLRRFLKEAHDPPLRRLPLSLITYSQEEITSAVVRAHPHVDAKGLEEYIKAWRLCQVSGPVRILVLLLKWCSCRRIKRA